MSGGSGPGRKGRKGREDWTRSMQRNVWHVTAQPEQTFHPHCLFVLDQTTLKPFITWATGCGSLFNQHDNKVVRKRVVSSGGRWACLPASIVLEEKGSRDGKARVGRRYRVSSSLALAHYRLTLLPPPLRDKSLASQSQSAEHGILCIFVESSDLPPIWRPLSWRSAQRVQCAVLCCMHIGRYMHHVTVPHRSYCGLSFPPQYIAFYTCLSGETFRLLNIWLFFSTALWL